MRFVVPFVLLGCACSPQAPPAVAPVAPTCPPLGAWQLTARASCAARPHELAFTVHAGPPGAADPRPLFDVTSPVLATGRTHEVHDYHHLLRITDARETAVGCQMKLVMEYVGPHSALEYIATVTLANGTVEGVGTYQQLIDDCRLPDDECTCESGLAIEGRVL